MRPTVSKGEQKFENNSLAKGKPTVSKGEKEFENKSFKGRPTVPKGDQQFQRENKSLAKGETNSFKGRTKV